MEFTAKQIADLIQGKVEGNKNRRRRTWCHLLFIESQIHAFYIRDSIKCCIS